MTPTQITIGVAILGLLQAAALWMMGAARTDRIRRDEGVNTKLDGVAETLTNVESTLARHDERIKTLFSRLGIDRRSISRDTGYPRDGE